MPVEPPFYVIYNLPPCAPASSKATTPPTIPPTPGTSTLSLEPAASTATTPQGKTLPAALYASQTTHADVATGSNIALNWFHIEATDSYWHNGGTGGYSSYALFSPGDDFALIVLFNTAGDKDTFADKLGQHIAQRLAGQPAVSLAP